MVTMIVPQVSKWVGWVERRSVQMWRWWWSCLSFSNSNLSQLQARRWRRQSLSAQEKQIKKQVAIRSSQKKTKKQDQNHCESKPKTKTKNIAKGFTDPVVDCFNQINDSKNHANSHQATQPVSRHTSNGHKNWISVELFYQARGSEGPARWER